MVRFTKKVRSVLVVAILIALYKYKSLSYLQQSSKVDFIWLIVVAISSACRIQALFGAIVGVMGHR